MKKQLTAILTVIAMMAIVVSCKKNENPSLSAVQVTGQDNGKTITILPGQTLRVTVSNPGDGGYTFDPVQYHSSILALKSHIHIPPMNSSTIGDFGADTWEFYGAHEGAAVIAFTASRGSDKSTTTTIFAATIVVK